MLEGQGHVGAGLVPRQPLVSCPSVFVDWFVTVFWNACAV